MANTPQNDLPMPANAVHTPMPAQMKASLPVRISGNQPLALDPDLAMALQDMCQASGQSWPDFIQGAINEALRSWMGR